MRMSELSKSDALRNEVGVLEDSIDPAVEVALCRPWRN
jgi:hypothetical protein